jgi:Arc/MetJ family transcription regulator
VVADAREKAVDADPIATHDATYYWKTAKVATMSVMSPPRPTSPRRKASFRKTSFELDFVLVEEARRILGTRTLTETVDAALDEVVKREGRKKLVEILRSGVLDLNDPEVMAGAWR